MRDLMALVDKSFLHRTAAGRYELHELLRRYAVEKLAAWPDAERLVRNRHSHFYSAALESWADELKGPCQQAALDEIETELENAHAAWAWAVEQGQVERLAQAMDGLGWFYTWRARYQEGETIFRTTVDALAATNAGQPAVYIARQQALARLWTWQSLPGMFLGHARMVQNLSRRSLALLEELDRAGHDVRRERAFALWVAGAPRGAWGIDRTESRALIEESLVLYRALGAQWETAFVLHLLADVLQSLGTYDEAVQIARESLAIHQQLGDLHGIADSLEALGWTLMEQGDLVEAEHLMRENLSLRVPMNDPIASAEAELRLSTILVFQGQFAEAYMLRQAVLAVMDEMVCDPTRVAHTVASLGEIDLLLGRYAEARRKFRTSLDQIQGVDDGWQAGKVLLYLGWATMAEGAYTEAQRWLQKSLVQFQRMETRTQVIRAHAALAGTALLQGDRDKARDQFSETLRLLTKCQSFIALLFTLPFAARMLAEWEKVEQAVEIYALASSYPHVANSRFFHDMVGQYISAAVATLPPEVVAAAQERGRSRDPWAAAEVLLIELSE